MPIDHHKQRTLILGAGPLAKVLMMEIHQHPQCPYRIVGIVTDNDSDIESSLDYPVLGTIDELQSIILSINPDLIIVSLSERRGYLPVHQLVEARVRKNIIIEDGEAVYEQLTGKLAIEALTPSDVIFSRDFQPTKFSLMTARIISFICAMTGIIVLLPLFIFIAAAIKIESRGPVFFIQERVGLAGQKFKLMKFRTMRPSGQRQSEWACDNRDRITRLGFWLRKFRLDELPQFINVIRGDMNLVGPRPHPASNFELFVLVSRNTPECGGQIPYYSLRSIVPPGITGWAQVRYRYANNLNEEIEKLRFDLFYVKYYSLWLDIRILFETVMIVLKGHNPAGDTDNEMRAVKAEENQIVTSSPSSLRKHIEVYPQSRGSIPRSSA